MYIFIKVRGFCVDMCTCGSIRVFFLSDYVYSVTHTHTYIWVGMCVIRHAGDKTLRWAVLIKEHALLLFQ